VALPCSKNEANRLGKRLAAEAPLAAEDEDLLEEILSAYFEAQKIAQDRLARLGLQATGRVKETPTLKEKLRKQSTMQLLSLDDVAGVRMVLHGGRKAQDRAVAAILMEFNSELAKDLIDRRATPSHGYRAVHVIVRLGELKVEIQVRTQLQDLWAQVIETLGTKWGRELRYGEPLEGARTPFWPGAEETREGLFGFCLGLSDSIARHEVLWLECANMRDELGALRWSPIWLWPPVMVLNVSLRYRLLRLERQGRQDTVMLREILTQLNHLVKQLEGAT